MNWTIERLSNERLEDSIARIYQEAHEEAPNVRVQETGVLAGLWAEFDYRLEQGLIEADPDTGNEAEYDYV